MVQVFISYSWDGLARGEWVNVFAEQLRRDGIGVVTDTTHVRPGTELPHFMEASVRDSDFVLVICTEKYKLRADRRDGGVGYETRLLSAEVFAFGRRDKVIPVLRGVDWQSSAPSYLLGSTYVDLRDGPRYESEYQKLVASLRAADTTRENGFEARRSLVPRTRKLRPPSVARLRKAAEAELQAIETRHRSSDAGYEIALLQDRIAELERRLRETRDPDLNQILAQLDRLDLDFVRWSGVALQELDNIRAQPKPLLTIDFSEIYRYMHFTDGGLLTSFTIAMLRKAKPPFYLLPGTLFELRAYLERRRDDYSDRDGIVRRLAAGSLPLADFLLRRHAPLQRLARLLDDAIIVPWDGPIFEDLASEADYIFVSHARKHSPVASYVDATNLGMVKQLRHHNRPAAHVTASPNVLGLARDLFPAADAVFPFPLLIHPAELALVIAANEAGVPEADLSGAARKLLINAPALLRDWTTYLRRGVPPPDIGVLRDFGEVLERSRDLITAFFAWVMREERADLFEDEVSETAPSDDFDLAYDEIVTTIDRLIASIDSNHWNANDRGE
jgi:hypothetical protein